MEIKNPVSGNNDLESPLEVRQSSSLQSDCVTEWGQWQIRRPKTSKPRPGITKLPSGLFP